MRHRQGRAKQTPTAAGQFAPPLGFAALTSTYPAAQFPRAHQSAGRLAYQHRTNPEHLRREGAGLRSGSVRARYRASHRDSVRAIPCVVARLRARVVPHSRDQRHRAGGRGLSAQLPRAHQSAGHLAYQHRANPEHLRREGAGLRSGSVRARYRASQRGAVRAIPCVVARLRARVVPHTRDQLHRAGGRGFSAQLPRAHQSAGRLAYQHRANPTHLRREGAGLRSGSLRARYRASHRDSVRAIPCVVARLRARDTMRRSAAPCARNAPYARSTSSRRRPRLFSAASTSPPKRRPPRVSAPRQSRPTSDAKEPAYAA